MIKNVFIGLGIAASVAAAVLLTVLFISCLIPSSLTNDQIITETKKCKDAGMDADQTLNGFTYSVTAVHCSPKADK